MHKNSLNNFNDFFQYCYFPDIDHCTTKPCQNGGTCEDGLTSYTCTCAVGWEGTDCDIGKLIHL